MTDLFPHDSRNPKTAETDLGGDVVEALPEACFFVDGRLVIRRANQAAARLTRLPELAGTPVARLMAAPAFEELANLVRQCIALGTHHVYRSSIVRDGSPAVPVLLMLARYPLAADAREHFCMLTMRDVSQERDRELDLLRFSNIVQYTTNPIEITDRQGRIVYANPAFERASGFSRAELIGKNPNIFGSGKQTNLFWKKIWDAILAGEIWMGEVENRRRNGEPFHTKLLISPIMGPDGAIAGFFGIHHDITEKKQLEQQLIHAQKMESIGLLTAGLAHEVGNPLTAISSLVQLLQRSSEDPFMLERLELIKSQVGRISRIIGDLVGFSRRSNFEMDLADLGDILRRSVQIVGLSRKARDIAIDAGILPGLPRIPLVPDQVEQVFINLLINAVDAINERADRERATGAVPEPGRISLTTSLTEESIIATVADNGTGIPESDMDKIFQPFFTTKQPGSGTGLGLWVSYGIVRSMRGTIAVDRNVPRGVTFTITFPLHPELT